MNNHPKIVFIVGPTAVGKSEVAYQLALQLNAEIVSCDSMLVYTEVSIASAKPTSAMRKKIKHHMVDVVSVEENFDVASFNQMATSAIKDILRRNKMPVVVGGSGLYMQILLDGIFESKSSEQGLRFKLEKEAQEKGIESLYVKLKKKDPVVAAKIHSNDARRIIRALEVIESEKRPISEMHKQRKGLWGEYQINIFCLNRERQELYRRIEQRVDAMFDNGVVEEMKKILGLHLSKTAQGIIGFKEIAGFLKGEYDVERAKYLLKLNTRHFAKRQLTWFRKDKRLQWIDLEEYQSTSDIVAKILRDIKKKGMND